MTPGPVRAFVAVQLDEAVRTALGVQLERLRLAAPRVAWVPAQNLHLTLRFLGGVEADTLPRVTRALEALAAEARPFELAVGGLGAFPTAARARVVWAGLSGGGEAVRALAERVEAALAPVGFEPEARPFSPHVTLGRVRAPRPDPRLEAALADGAGLDFGRVRVDTVWLMRSDLEAAGARYSAIAAVPLAGR